jgi:rRNA-processing protein FCF1
MGINLSGFKQLEKDLNLFSLTGDQIPVWERIRFSVTIDIKQQGGQGQAHTDNEDGWRTNLRGLGLLLKNVLYRNPYLAGKHDVLFFGHQRRKLQDDGYWWDLYCDPIHEQSDLDYVHMEAPYLMSHSRPAKTENLRYLELIEYGGKLQQELGIRSPSIPDHVVSRLKEAESEIDRRFDAEVNLVSLARDSLHERNTTLPLYDQLIDRIGPSVAVVVVSYDKETFIEACKRNDVPVVELQHGVIYDEHYGYSYPIGETKETFPDYLFTFGEFWNEGINYPIPDSYVIPVGYPYLEQRLDRYRDVESGDQLLFISQGTIGHELSQFALAVEEDSRIDYDIVYKLHPGEYDRWRNEYPWLTDTDIRVVDSPEPPLYELFAQSNAQIGVGSTAVYEGLCFDLTTLIFDTHGTTPLQPLVDSEVAISVQDVDDVVQVLSLRVKAGFDRERFFRSDSVHNIHGELQQIK